MQKIWYGALFLFFFSGSGLAQDGISEARWPAKKIIADGNNSEWKKPLNLYDAITGLFFTMANDSNYLYLCITNNDERKVTKLMKAGWRIALSSKEKKKRFETSIAFPGVPAISEPGKDEGVTQVESAAFKSQVALYKLSVQSVKTSGFVSANGDIALQNNNGMIIGIGTDSSQEIIFELAIPLKELFPDNNAALHEEMTLGMTVHPLKKPAYHGDPDGRDLVGKGGKGGGKRNGRSAGASENGVYPTDRSYLFTEIDFKQKFRLTAK